MLPPLASTGTSEWLFNPCRYMYKYRHEMWLAMHGVYILNLVFDLGGIYRTHEVQQK